MANAVVAVVLTAATAAQSKFTLKVHTGKGQIGYDVNSTMIIGERDMLLIDPQFSLREAHKLAAEILETKKHLATVYSTHPHPDHLFGPEELATPVLTLEGEAFPITGGAQGAYSFVWAPPLKTVVTGDIVFDHVYFGVPRPEPRAT